MLFSLHALSAQENCTNGIDDDGDNLIDLNDPDCSCDGAQPYTLTGYFEEMTCCPMGITGGTEPGIGCLIGWSQASNPTTDYHHECGFVGGGLLPFLPLPPPSGQGAIGFITRQGYQEYVGMCLPMTMIAGQTYTVEMYVGFNAAPFPPISYESHSPFEIGIYGTTSCNDYPANISSCIDNAPNWSEIGTQVVSGTFGAWTFTTFSVTPTQNYAAIAIGGSCGATVVDSSYHFLDNVLITGNFMGEGMPIGDITMSGNCVSGVQLSIEEVPGATYHWYLNGVAIDGATANPYVVPAGADGTYTVLVDNGTGCALSNDLEVVIDTDVLAVEGEVFAVSCSGGLDGSVTLDIPTSNPPVSVLWQSGATSETITDLTAGTYTVTITDANGCTGEGSFEVTEPNEPVAGIFTDVNHPVAPQTRGSALVVASGGVPPYTYLWDNGETAANGTMLDSGTHSVTITDQNGCEQILEVTINPPLALDSNTENALCSGDCNGSIAVIVTGGMPNYSYLWSNGNTLDINSGLCPGTYSITVIDNSGTEIIRDFGVNAPAELAITGQVVSGICGGETGSIVLEASGGTPEYHYQWSNGASTSVLIDLGPGVYTVTVTDDQGCTDEQSFEVPGIEPIEISAGITEASCGGGSDGAIDITVVNGTGPYTYLWSNGFTGEDPTGLSLGIYSVSVTDASGCQVSASFMISSGEDLAVLPASQATSCPEIADGTAQVVVMGGTPPYTYAWSNGASVSSINNIPAGTYTVTITDSGNCQTMEVINIGAGDGIDVSLAGTDVQCNGQTDGMIDLEVAKGTAPFEYLWSSSQTSEDILDLAPGIYYVTVTDASSCTAHDSVEIREPPALTISSVSQPATCQGNANGSLGVVISGGTPTYQIVWSTGDSSATIDSLAAGVFSITVTDANSCILDSVFTVDMIPGPILTSTVKQSGCHGEAVGEIDIDVTGAAPPYSFLWSNGDTTEDLQDLPPGNYSVTVTDSNGCRDTALIEVSASGTMMVVAQVQDIRCSGEKNGAIDLSVTGGADPLIFTWSNGSTNEDLSGLAPGNYSVTITDANGCSYVNTFEIIEPEPLVLTISSIIQPSAPDDKGTAQIAVTGGIPPYEIQWSNGEIGLNATQLDTGAITVTATDAKGCMASIEIEITFEALNIGIDIVSNSCFGNCEGQITIMTTGGLPPYAYTWAHGDTSPTIRNLCNGTYSITVTDANGISASLATIEVSSPPEIRFHPTVLDISCIGRNDGSIIPEATGGTAPYAFAWSDGSSAAERSDLLPGIYALTVTDVNGCTSDTSFMIGDIVPADLLITPFDIDCTHPSGSIRIEGSNPKGYPVLINGLAFGDSTDIEPNGLDEGTYVIEYEVSETCHVLVDSVEIRTISDFEVEVLPAELEVSPGDVIQLEVRVIGKIGSYTIDWVTADPFSCGTTDPMGNCTAIALEPTVNQIVRASVLDDIGCEGSAEAQLILPTSQVLYIPNVFSPNADGTNDIFRPVAKNSQVHVNVFAIFNRWGALVHEEKELSLSGLAGWRGLVSGKRCAPGVYIYVLGVEFQDGTKEHLTGDVTLIR